MTLEFKSGKVIEATLITKAANVAIVREDLTSKYLLVSRYALKDQTCLSYKDEL